MTQPKKKKGPLEVLPKVAPVGPVKAPVLEVKPLPALDIGPVLIPGMPRLVPPAEERAEFASPEVVEARRPGPKSKLTPEVQERIVFAVESGNYREVAAQWAGINVTTLNRWLARTDEPYVTFTAAVAEAEKKAEVRAVAIVMAAAVNDPKCAQWWLERKCPERWGRKDRVDAGAVKLDEIIAAVHEKSRARKGEPAPPKSE